LVHHLAQWEPAFVPAVVATNTYERWLLMRACRGRALDSGAPLTAWERVAGAYAELQVESSTHAATLRALGCREHGPLELRTSVGPLVGDEAALLRGTEHGLTAEETGRLRQLRPSLEAACDELAQSGLPRALEHGDLWSSNVYVGDDRVAFIDWTDASLSHPFFSLAPLLLSASWDPYLSTVPDAQQRIVDSYLEHWTTYAAPERLRRALALARPLAAMHIAITYWRDIPRPHTQWWIKRMVPFFLRMALAEWDLMS
jgi:aminoglycoside phosphotransferase (APT) family kinase protein